MLYRCLIVQTKHLLLYLPGVTVYPVESHCACSQFKCIYRLSEADTEYFKYTLELQTDEAQRFYLTHQPTTNFIFLSF